MIKTMMLLQLVTSLWLHENVLVGEYSSTPQTRSTETVRAVISQNRVEVAEVMRDLAKFEESLIEPCNVTNTFKSYMDYRSITYTNSRQYEMQQIAHTGKNGIRMYGEYMMVALAGFEVGTALEITFTGGEIIEAVVADVKDAGHDGCKSLRDGSVVEFIVDTIEMPNIVKRLGNFNIIYSGKIEQLRKLGEFYV